MAKHPQNLTDLTLLTSQVFEQSSVAMLILDADLVVVAANAVASNITGFESTGLCEQSIASMFDESDSSRLIDSIRQLSDADSFSGEFTAIKQNSHFFTGLITVNLLQHPQLDQRYFLVVMVDISEQKQRESELRFYSEVDPLTHLGNRKYLMQSLDNAINAANRFGYTVALLFLDLDGFKQINDRLGHGEGDNVLLEVAQRLKHCVRQVDTVARLGGDEFVVILNGTSKEMIAVTAKRIIDFLTISVEDQHNDLQVSASIGISLYPQDGKNPLQLLKYADEAMYKAKSKGKRQFCWHLEI